MAKQRSAKTVSAKASAANDPAPAALSSAPPAPEKRKRGRPPKVRPATSGTDVVPAALEAMAAPSPVDVAEFSEAVMSPAVTSDSIEAVQEMPAAIQKGTETMATTASKTADAMNYNADKVQNLFGDVGARFKAGIEKSSKLGEEIVDLAKGNVEAVVASAKVAAKGSEAIGQDAAAYSKKSFETAVAAMKSFASVKSPTEFFQLQSEYAKSSFDSAVAEASKFSESMMKLAGDVAQPISTRYSVAADKIKTAAL